MTLQVFYSFPVTAQPPVDAHGVLFQQFIMFNYPKVVRMVVPVSRLFV